MKRIDTPRQLRYFLSQNPQLQEIKSEALNKAINLQGYKISRRKNKFEVYSLGRKYKKEALRQSSLLESESSEQSSEQSPELQIQINQICHLPPATCPLFREFDLAGDTGDTGDSF
ncbi:MAG: hypothetical protein EZS28_009122 [Streblomastix strix]|uniref:Uncharacterized protein n=1 Tax=Streblomastix strix TaxID=222440 RepID=A0A5J4WK82_9EUKA|nr:MAG: hypothetical protein EZS28_009122 [Streblomastix strix]